MNHEQKKLSANVIKKLHVNLPRPELYFNMVSWWDLLEFYFGSRNGAEVNKHLLTAGEFVLPLYCCIHYAMAITLACHTTSQFSLLMFQSWVIWSTSQKEVKPVNLLRFTWFSFFLSFSVSVLHSRSFSHVQFAAMILSTDLLHSLGQILKVSKGLE